jgi:hypothetical protein
MAWKFRFIDSTYSSAYTPIQILGQLEYFYFSLKNTSFDDFWDMESSDIILVVPGMNNKVI